MKTCIPQFRFSVAHEIAHAVLRHQGVRFRHAERKAFEKANPNVWRDEREAEKFAAIFLAPTHLAKKCKNVEELQRKCGLSSGASVIRMKEIEAHIRRTNGEVPPLPPKVVDFLRYAESKGYRISRLKVDLPRNQTCQTSQATTTARCETNKTNTAPRSSSDIEICNGCGNLSLDRVGLRLVCRNCGMRLPL
jgi:hypothetical protein